MSRKWEPRYIVRKAEGVDGPPIPEDEPCLVIRAQDILAVDMLLQYHRLYRERAGPEYDEQVGRELNKHLDTLFDWKRKHPDKFADR